MKLSSLQLARNKPFVDTKDFSISMEEEGQSIISFTFENKIKCEKIIFKVKNDDPLPTWQEVEKYYEKNF